VECGFKHSEVCIDSHPTSGIIVMEGCQLVNRDEAESSEWTTASRRRSTRRKDQGCPTGGVPQLGSNPVLLNSASQNQRQLNKLKCFAVFNEDHNLNVEEETDVGDSSSSHDGNQTSNCTDCEQTNKASTENHMKEERCIDETHYDEQSAPPTTQSDATLKEECTTKKTHIMAHQDQQPVLSIHLDKSGSSKVRQPSKRRPRRGNSTTPCTTNYQFEQIISEAMRAKDMDSVQESTSKAPDHGEQKTLRRCLSDGRLPESLPAMATMALAAELLKVAFGAAEQQEPGGKSAGATTKHTRGMRQVQPRRDPKEFVRGGKRQAVRQALPRGTR